MIIRPARREDVPQILAIYSMDPATGHRELLGDPLPALYYEAFDMMNAHPDQVVLVAEDDAKVIGTLQITFIQHLLSRAFRRAVVEAVFVHPSHQGSGVGTALFKAAAGIALAAKCGTLELTSNKARAGAHKFYERLGFKASHEGFKLLLKQP